MSAAKRPNHLVTVLAGMTLVAVGIVVVKRQAATTAATLQRIDFSTAPFTHVGVSDAVCCEPQPSQSVYSGNWLIHVQQWGILGVNVTTGVKTMISPVEGPGGCVGGGCHYGQTCFQPPIQKMYFADVFQSVVAVYATPGAPKWVVSTGYRFSDRFDGRTSEVLQVYSLTDAQLKYIGDIKAPPTIIGPSPLVVLDGDVLWVSQWMHRPPNPLLWSRFDLNTRGLLEADVPESRVPAFTPQHGVGGYTYKIWATGKIYPPYNMLCEFSAIRSDVAFATPTAGPSPIVTAPKVTPSKTRTVPLPCCDPDKMPCPAGAVLCYKSPTRAPSTTRYPSVTRTAPSTATAAIRTTTPSPTPSRTVTLRASSTHTPIPPAPTLTPSAVAIGPTGCKAKQ